MNIEKLVEKLQDNRIQFLLDQPMSKYTTFCVGGVAPIIITPESVDEIKLSLEFCKDVGKPFILGKGSNILVKDDELEYPVILIGKKFSGINKTSQTSLEVLAGTSLNSFCSFARDNHLGGLAFAYGIPGTVGGAIYMNAGAYGGEVKDFITSVTYMTDSGEVITKKGDELEFAYRHSFFSGKNFVILSAVFELAPQNKEDVTKEMVEFAQQRRDKQPLNFPSAGSTFKRPTGHFAGALIEQCGLKGHSVGGATVSEKHAGFIVNSNNATASDIITLIEKVTTIVKRETGVLLEPEVQILP